MAPLPPANPGTASPFGGYYVRIDPWAVEYGGETPTEFQADADERLNSISRRAGRRGLGADHAAGRSRAASRCRSSTGCGAWRRDSSSRRNGRIVHGALGAYGVGVVDCRKGGRPSARSGADASSSSEPARFRPRLVALAPGLVYEPRSVPEEDPDAPLRGLHREMRDR